MKNATCPTRLLRLPQVIELTQLKRDSIYRLGKLGKFPTRIKVSERASRWREDQIQEWINERTAESQRKT